MSPFQKLILGRILDRYSPNFITHGGCIGADEEFHKMCLSRKTNKSISHYIMVFPSNLKDQQGNWKGANYVCKGQDPLVRNQIIVDQSDILIAAPRSDNEEQRSGTWATIRYARKIGVPVIQLPRG